MNDITTEMLLSNFEVSLGICEKATHASDIISLIYNFYETHGKGSEFNRFITQVEVQKAGNNCNIDW
jgi:hypothetical protein